MPEIYKIFKSTDAELLKSFIKFRTDAGIGSMPELKWTVFSGIRDVVHAPLDKFNDHPAVEQILSKNASLVREWYMPIPLTQQMSMKIVRGEYCDTLTLELHQQSPAEEAARVLAAISDNFPLYVRSEATDKILGDELAEFYNKREAGLLRLEGLSQRLIEETERYRVKLDGDYATRIESARQDTEKRIAELDQEYNERHTKLKEREEALIKRQEELDDRDSTHARRQLRVDMKKLLKDRATDFNLTKSTAGKRTMIHIVFSVLLLITLASSIISLLTISTTEDAGLWLKLVKLGLSIAGFAATAVFYIQWLDQWFRQHADEEFKLKRLDLDIDRATWVVESAREWASATNKEMPAELVEHLARGLFENTSGSSSLRHPAEDFASKLLGASSGLKVNVPGVIEANLDRKGIKKLHDSDNT